jgi:hypothetical protein
MTANSGETGWFTDPFSRHDARWMSQGSPTKLVRDGDIESYDDPPEEPYARTPGPVELPGSGPRRADDPGGEPYDPKRARRAVQDVFNETSGTAWQRISRGAGRGHGG